MNFAHEKKNAQQRKANNNEVISVAAGAQDTIKENFSLHFPLQLSK